MEKQWLTVEEAVPIIGRSKNQIRNLMKADYINKTNKLPIGRVVPPGKGGKNCSYRIYKPLLAKYLGLDHCPEEWG